MSKRSKIDRSSYPPIGDYALISDCNAMALVSRSGSIDWCCLPRVDSGSCFGRLLDWEKGGCFELEPVGDGYSSFRSYRDDTMVLETTFAGAGGEARVLDLLVADGEEDPRRPQLLRVVEGLRGLVRFRVRIAPRFDYGEVKPWLRYHGRRLFTAIGGDDCLLISSDVDLERQGDHELGKEFEVNADERVRISIQYSHPAEIDPNHLPLSSAADLDRRLESSLAFWRDWARQVEDAGTYGPGIKRSALVLKALTVKSTGAIAAAATTSLPESPGGPRNWDYRFSWIRDSAFSVHSLSDIGCYQAADDFRRFIQRSAAGAADDLQIMYGVGGERRLTELELDLDGYAGSRPVRIGNAAYRQTQLDAYGELLELSWRWHLRGHAPDDDYWRFLVGLVETAARVWKEPDRGLWEIRGEPRHFVHSKVMLWAAIDRGVRLAEEGMRAAPLERWKKAREAIRREVETKGFDRKRNAFVQSYGSEELDSALLLLPTVGFIEYRDPRMVGTVDAIKKTLDRNGLVLRYQTGATDDGLSGSEGAFLACTLWLAECLAHQGRIDEAREAFRRVLATSNDLGLFSEEYDPDTEQMLGNFPQALTHLSHISAAVALARLERPDAFSAVA